jgi:hypothetical protein
MAVMELMVTGTITKLRAPEDFNCYCCNADGANKEKGVIRAGKLFPYVNLYSQFVLKWNDEFVIPYAYRTRKTMHMNPKNFKKYVKMHMICPRCFNVLVFLMGISRPTLPAIGEAFSIKTGRMYYTRVSVSEKKYVCTCCREMIPTGSEYVRFGIFQTGCTCMKCFDVFRHLE